jgi:hypothetical protein
VIWWLLGVLIALAILWVIITVSAYVIYFSTRPGGPGGTTCAEDERDARRWLVFVVLPWLALLVTWPVRVTYRHVTGRERRRRAYQTAHGHRCCDLVEEWTGNAARYRAAGYPLSAAVTENHALLMAWLARSFADDAATTPTSPLVLSVPDVDVSHAFDEVA